MYEAKKWSKTKYHRFVSTQGKLSLLSLRQPFLLLLDIDTLGCWRRCLREKHEKVCEDCKEMCDFTTFVSLQENKAEIEKNLKKMSD